MGFRTVFVTADRGLSWPEWFHDKWQDCIHFTEDDGTLAASKECKMGVWEDLIADIQGTGAVDTTRSLVIVFLHECDGITRAEVFGDRVVWSEPARWKKVESVTHSYCYGCSDLPEKAQAVAMSIRDEKRFADLPVLADVLEEAGYDDELVLRRLRCVRADH